MRIGFALHGGAGVDPARDYSAECDHMRGLATTACARLRDGEAALEVVTATVVELEASGLYIAGRGASPNDTGGYELDACIVDGASGRSGAVAALEGFQSPVTIARAVMERTAHVLLAGAGAARFAHSHGFAPVTDPASWYTHALANERQQLTETGTGTVGCVVLDRQGNLAAATSTAGTFNKLAGRVGDTPIVGASTWADERLAISSTGQGEYFVRAAAAAQVAFRVRYGGESLGDALARTLADIRSRGGFGGMIAVDRDGVAHAPCVSAGMKHAYLATDGRIVVGYRHARAG